MVFFWTSRSAENPPAVAATAQPNRTNQPDPPTKTAGVAGIGADPTATTAATAVTPATVPDPTDAPIALVSPTLPAPTAMPTATITPERVFIPSIAEPEINPGYGHILTVNVLDSAGQPIQDLQVTIRQGDLSTPDAIIILKQERTDANGSIILGIKDETYNVYVTVEGWNGYTKSIDFPYQYQSQIVAITLRETAR